MSSTDISGDIAEDLRDHHEVIKSLTVVQQSLTLLDRDTREIELEVHEFIDCELKEMRQTIDQVKEAKQVESNDVS